MEAKMATSCKEKVVLVTLYVEKARKRLHHHHTIKGEEIQLRHGVAGKGYNRRAMLLRYSQSLRESARSSASASLNPGPISSKEQQPVKVAAVQSTPKHDKVPACLGEWKFSIASLLRSFTSLQAKKLGKKKVKKKQNGTSRDKVEAVIKSLEVQKKLRFISKLLKPSQKHR